MIEPSEIRLAGMAASAGIVTGPAYCYRPVDLAIPERQSGSVDQEMARFAVAQASAGAELSALQQRITRIAGDEYATIFEAHSLLLDDPLLVDGVRSRIEGGLTVEWALRQTVDEIAGMLTLAQDELLAARAVDVHDIGQRLLRLLLDVPDTSLSGLSEPSIVLADDLTPSDTARLNPELVLGFCTKAGGLTSHTVILARTLCIPAVVGIGESLRVIHSGQQMLMNGHEGIVIVNPASATLRAYQDMGQQRAIWQKQISQRAGEDTITADGDRVAVMANIGDVTSAKQAAVGGAEGVGLLRTEFLYLNVARPPTEEEQARTYRKIFALFGQLPVIVRTLDIGADKSPGFISFPQETNPFLGWRAIRVGLDEPPLFKTQLRAILRAAVDYNVRLMLPLVNDLDELHQVKALLAEVRAELDQSGIVYAEHMPLGIMIETPAAAMLADMLASEVDFFSIGTNDLTQYTLAVDRMNERIAHLYQPLHPAVLRLIRHTIVAGHQAGIPVGMCGELAGLPRAVPLLLGMGLDVFSMAASTIPETKWLIRQLKRSELRALVDEVLALATVAEVEQRLAGFVRPYYAEPPGG